MQLHIHSGRFREAAGGSAKAQAATAAKLQPSDRVDTIAFNLNCQICHTALLEKTGDGRADLLLRHSLSNLHTQRAHKHRGAVCPEVRVAMRKHTVNGVDTCQGITHLGLIRTRCALQQRVCGASK